MAIATLVSRPLTAEDEVRFRDDEGQFLIVDRADGSRGMFIQDGGDPLGQPRWRALDPYEPGTAAYRLAVRLAQELYPRALPSEPEYPWRPEGLQLIRDHRDHRRAVQRTGRNRPKLTPEQRDDIRSRYFSGCQTQQQIAEAVGVCVSTVSKVVHYRGPYR